MYGTVIIKTASAQAQFKTWAHDSIYAFLTDHGYSHDTAADVAGWADLASVGEEYELDGAAIIIVDYVEIRSVVLEHIEPVRNDACVLKLDTSPALCAVDGRYRAGLNEPRKDILQFVHQYPSNVLRSLTCVV